MYCLLQQARVGWSTRQFTTTKISRVVNVGWNITFSQRQLHRALNSLRTWNSSTTLIYKKKNMYHGKHRVFPHIYWIFHGTLDYFYIYYGFEMAGPHTAKTTRCHSQASSRVKSPRQTGQGKPRNTWWRTVLEAEIKTDAKNRVRWRILVEALCSAAECWDAIYIYGFQDCEMVSVH